MMKNLVRLVAIGGMLAIAGAASATSTYHVQDLGTLGGDESRGWSVNNSGDVTGDSSVASGDVYPFITLPGNIGLGPVGTLGGTSGGAFSINDRDQIAGQSNISGNTASHAFRFTPGVGLQDLGTLGGADSRGVAINQGGQVAGWSSTADGSRHAFLFDGAALIDLGTLGGSDSLGWAINNSDQVTGYSYVTVPGGKINRAFVYTPGSGMVDIGTLGGSNSEGYAISDTGMVTGNSYTATGYDDAFVYTPGAGLVDLGTLGGYFSNGNGINQAGEIVGYSLIRDNQTEHAFVDDSGVMTDLDGLIDPSSGWVLNRAEGVNDIGQITGFGTIGGQVHAFLLTPDGQYVPPTGNIPEPSSWLMMLVGFAFIGVSGRYTYRFRGWALHIDTSVTDRRRVTFTP